MKALLWKVFMEFNPPGYVASLFQWFVARMSEEEAEQVIRRTHKVLDEYLRSSVKV